MTATATPTTEADLAARRRLAALTLAIESQFPADGDEAVELADLFERYLAGGIELVAVDEPQIAAAA